MQDVIKSFSKLKNYNIDWKLLKAKEYGVPQNRPRIILVGIRNDIKFKSLSKTANGLLPDGVLNPPHLKDVLSDLIDINYTPGGATKLYPRKATTKFQQEIRKQNGKILDKGDPLTEHVYTKHSKNITEKFKFMIENDGVISKNFKQKNFRRRFYLKSGTIRVLILLQHLYQMITFIMHNQEFLQLESGLGYKPFQIGINLVDRELLVESGERGTQKKIII